MLLFTRENVIVKLHKNFTAKRLLTVYHAAPSEISADFANRRVHAIRKLKATACIKGVAAAILIHHCFFEIFTP